MSEKGGEIMIPSAANSAEGHRGRLRERFLKGGLSAFAPHEVVELLLTLCLPRRDVKLLAKTLLKRYGSLRGILDAPLESLQEVKGMGKVAPTAFKIIKSAAELYLMESAEGSDILNNYEKLEAFWRARIGGLKHEVVEVAYLDKAYRLMRNGVERLVEGSIDSAVISQQQLIKKALSAGARFLVLAHNHPTGGLDPSPEDRFLTEKIATAAKAVEIELLDHWIVGESGCYSFRKANEL